MASVNILDAITHRSLFAFPLGLLQVIQVAAAEVDDLSSQRDIRSILNEHCFDCHGATKEIEAAFVPRNS
jgi:hypothetical protein